jgi:hypothetical protein
MNSMALNSAPEIDSVAQGLKTWMNAGCLCTELEFQLDVPELAVLRKSSRELPSKQSPLVDLAGFRVRDGLNPLEIVVQGTVMKHEVALRDYFNLWSEVGNETILDACLIDDDPDRPSVLLSRQFPDDQTWVTRRYGFKVWQGFLAWVITVNVACPAENLEMNATLMQTIAESLRPVHPVEYGFAEHLRLVTRGVPVDFASYLPISWQELPHRHDQPGPMRNFWRRELRGKYSGAFGIVAANKDEFSTSELFLREAVSTWEPLGIDAEKTILERPSHLGEWKTVRSVQELVSDKAGKAVAHRLELMLADTGSHWFYAEVMGPSPEQDFEAWAVNHRALDLFISHFRHA